MNDPKKTVREMQIGDIGYTTPWQAFEMNRKLYLRSSAHLFDKVYATSCMGVQRTKSGVKVMCMGEEARKWFDEAIQPGGEYLGKPPEGILIEDVSTLDKVDGQWTNEN